MLNTGTLKGFFKSHSVIRSKKR